MPPPSLPGLLLPPVGLLLLCPSPRGAENRNTPAHPPPQQLILNASALIALSSYIERLWRAPSARVRSRTHRSGNATFALSRHTHLPPLPLPMTPLSHPPQGPQRVRQVHRRRQHRRRRLHLPPLRRRLRRLGLGAHPLRPDRRRPGPRRRAPNRAEAAHAGPRDPDPAPPRKGTRARALSRREDTRPPSFSITPCAQSNHRTPHPPPPTPILHPPTRTQDLPLLFVAAACASGALLDAADEVPFAVLGVACAWGYLRFFQEQRDGTRGDRSDAFSLSSFFPRALQPMARGRGLLCVCCCVRCDGRHACWWDDEGRVAPMFLPRAG